MTKPANQISLRTAAVIAGFATLTMVICAPFAELYAYPKLVIPGNAAETVKNIVAHQTLFAALIMGYVITFISDIIAAWALYILLKPANVHLSVLTALFRLVYAFIAIVALLNLVTVFRIVTMPEYLTVFKPGQIQAQVTLSLNTFRYGFHFGLLFFGVYLCLLGYLVWISKYIPWILGVLLIISGLGYFVTSLEPYLFPAIKTDFAVYTFYGELIFMFWLIIRGWKIPELKQEISL
ncbi:MAG: DUF4386 domain-containing protein [Sphingobacteriales bacterium]